ncbi:MAG: hypothetical protein NUV54_02935 [Candidatus Taylorbacteria bacterium]|nr:hypothetical protein [Candidatus Taylorbacteria bacterium]
MNYERLFHRLVALIRIVGQVEENGRLGPAVDHWMVRRSVVSLWQTALVVFGADLMVIWASKLSGAERYSGSFAEQLKAFGRDICRKAEKQVLVDQMALIWIRALEDGRGPDNVLVIWGKELLPVERNHHRLCAELGCENEVEVEGERERRCPACEKAEADGIAKLNRQADSLSPEAQALIEEDVERAEEEGEAETEAIVRTLKGEKFE